MCSFCGALTACKSHTWSRVTSDTSIQFGYGILGRNAGIPNQIPEAHLVMEVLEGSTWYNDKNIIPTDEFVKFTSIRMEGVVWDLKCLCCWNDGAAPGFRVGLVHLRPCSPWRFYSYYETAVPYRVDRTHNYHIKYWNFNIWKLIINNCKLIINKCRFIMNACLFIMNACGFIMNACRFIMNACLFIINVCLFIINVCLFIKCTLQFLVTYSDIPLFQLVLLNYWLTRFHLPRHTTLNPSWPWWSSSNGNTKAWSAWDSPESTFNSIIIPPSIKTVFKCMILAVGARKRHEIMEGVEEAHRTTNNRKTYPSCHSSIIPIPCSPKTVSWFKGSPFYLVEKEMECKGLVDVLKQPKKETQHRTHTAPCGDFIECTKMMLFPLLHTNKRMGEELALRRRKKGGIHEILTVVSWWMVHCAAEDLVVFGSAGGARIGDQLHERSPWL